MKSPARSDGRITASANSIAAEEYHDEIAPVYDDLFSRGGSGDRIRRRVQDLLLERFRPGEHVLELNCGTGTDAVALAEHGIRVTATDISPRMVEMTAEKSRLHGLEDMMATSVLDAAEVGVLGQGVFDGAFSNFNGLNYLEDVGIFADQIGGVLRPGASFFCTVLNPVCLWEVLYFAGTLRPRLALKRITHRGDELTSGRIPLTLRLYTPRELAGYFAKEFTVRRIRGFGFLLPPAGFAEVYRTKERVLRSLEWLEDMISGSYPVYSLCDHYLVEFQKRRGVSTCS